jgi:hypothetical protein
MVPDNALQRTFCMQYNNETSTCFTIDMYRKQYIVTARHALPRVGEYVTIEIQHDGQWKPLDCRVVGSAPGDIDIAVLGPSHAISPSLTLEPTTRSICLGQDAYFLGFPYGLQAEGGDANADFPFPLVKKACVSMLSLIPGKPQYMLLDGYTNPGFSGAPVIFSPPGHPASVMVAGVVSGYRYGWDNVYVDNKETDMFVRYNTGIIMAYSIEHAVELIRANPIGAPL